MNLFIVLVGSRNEKDKYKKDLVKNICEEKIIDLMGCNITKTYACLKKCNLFIGNDSGSMHLSAVAGIPTIGLFGPTNNKLYSPFGKNCYIIRTKETYEQFKVKKINKYKSYMESIEVKDIIEMIEKNNFI